MSIETSWTWWVVVLAHPRSGSNSLVEILERHQSVESRADSQRQNVREQNLRRVPLSAGF